MRRHINILDKNMVLHIDERKMFMAIKEAWLLVEGSIQLQYAKLWDYSHELTRSNEGSTMKINGIHHSHT